MTRAPKRKPRMKPSYDELVDGLRKCLSALDSLMGDSDLDEDDSPEMKACQLASGLIARATLSGGKGKGSARKK